MKKTSKKSIILILVLVALAIPLAWFHLNKFEEVRLLESEKDALATELQLCQEASEVDELGLFYELNGLEDVAVTQKEVAFADLFTAEDLEAQATGDCAKTPEEGYFETLVSKFEGVKGVQYDFTGNEMGAETYTITLFPNEAGYGTSASFEEDFEICSAGGSAYPARMNENVLMFTSGCSAGYGDEIPALTCADIKEALSVEFN